MPSLLCACGLVAALLAAPAGAEPVASDEQADLHASWDPAVEWPPALADLPATLSMSSTESEIDRQFGAERKQLIPQAWSPPPASWMHAAAVVNLGEFPTLNDPSAKAESEIRTLEWVIAERQRIAARQAAEPAEAMSHEEWWRRLLPSTWVPFLKQHRDWVLAGGAGMLLLSWMASAFSRRPGARSRPTAPEVGRARESTKPHSMRRRRRSGHHSSRHAGSVSRRHSGSQVRL